MKAIISGGGTGGHIFPAIAIADALKEVHPNIEILFVGANGKMEMQKVPNAGYQIVGLDVVGFHRKQIWRNLMFPFKLGKSLIQAIRVIRNFRPDFALGVGGYASGPVLRIANSFGVPTFLQEQNSFAGVTNKLLAKKAKRIYVAYKGMDRFFEKTKVSLVGNPVRKNVYEHNYSLDLAKKRLGINHFGKIILISGGSLGARSINDGLVSCYDFIKKRKDLFFYWQVGKLYIDKFSELSVAKLPNVKVVDFIEDMGAAYKMADLVVCRAGALTISEITLLGKPSILIPSPNVAEDHQTHNAMALVQNDAALIIKDDFIGQELPQRIVDLIDNAERMNRLSHNAYQMGRQNAAQEIVKDMFSTLKLYQE